MQQYVAREQMQHLLLNNDIPNQKIVIDKSEYAKSKIGSNEISINGKLYDIRSIKTNGDLIELEVINDTKEEGIIGKISQLSKSTTHKDNKLLEILVGLLTLDFIHPGSVHEICQVQLINDEGRIISIPYTNPLLSFFGDITGPPPKIA